MRDVLVASPKVLHVVPRFFAEREHDADVTCWCEPTLTYEDELTSGRVYTHRRVQ